MQKIVPNIWCNGDAAEAGEFYATTFRDTTSSVTSTYPTEGLLDFQQPLAGKPLTVGVTIRGYELSLINAGDEFRPNPSLSFMLNFDPLAFDEDHEAAQAELDRVWAVLSDGGEVLMPLQSYPFSKHYGWVQDRYGVSWQLMLTDPAGDWRPFILPSFMFAGPARGSAKEAVAKYIALMPDSYLGTQVPYPDDPAAIMFSDFQLAGQWFTGMDGDAQGAVFTCGVSLEVRCADQAEIDTYWDALSAVPEAEQCGWLADAYGVSWQIVPENMGELMERPQAFEHMLPMKKIVIADL